MKSPYKVEPLPNGVTRIAGYTDELMYLVCGEKKAALVDTGTGVGNLRSVVQELTDLPVEILLTHGHGDHCDGAFYYDAVHIHPADVEMMRFPMQLPGVEEGLMEEMAADGYDRSKKLCFYPTYEGDVFDLGGRSLEAVALPGHTLGSLAFWDRENRLLFTGDACNKRTFLFLPDSTTLLAYMETLRKLMAMLPDIDHIYNGHDEGEIPKDCPANILACCVQALNGVDDALSFDFMGAHGWAAKEIVGEVERKDGVFGNVIYNKDRLF